MGGSFLSDVVFALCFATTLISHVYGIFNVPCPMGCTQSRCTMGLGCSLGNCMEGWCGKHGGRNVGMICLPSCPAGQYCYRELTKICTACGVSNCERCSERYTCDACKTSYTLSSDKRQCTTRSG